MNPHHPIRRIALCLLLSCLAFSCERAAPPPGPPARTLVVAAASDLKFAFDQIALAFVARNPDVDIQTTYGASGTLTAQIESGAPFDLFLSADTAYPQRLIDKDKAAADSLLIYATGHIVIWARSDSGSDPAANGEKSLLASSIKKIAIANPTHAPYGRAAEAALKKLGVYEAIKPKLVLGENIAQAAQFVESGNADIGIISQSIALAPPMRGKGRSWLFPADAYPPIHQAAVIPVKSRSPAEAKKLRDFLVSKEAEDILAKFGFTSGPTR